MNLMLGRAGPVLSPQLCAASSGPVHWLRCQALMPPVRIRFDVYLEKFVESLVMC